jgi:hypothetical protein
LAFANGKARRIRQYVDLASLATPLQEQVLYRGVGAEGQELFMLSFPLCADPGQELELDRDIAYIQMNYPAASYGVSSKNVMPVKTGIHPGFPLSRE